MPVTKPPAVTAAQPKAAPAQEEVPDLRLIPWYVESFSRCGVPSRKPAK